jgi:ribosomal protein L7Ae-like RNA K-turn-binding protein
MEMKLKEENAKIKFKEQEDLKRREDELVKGVNSSIKEVTDHITKLNKDK